jgi:hypothetical protein
MIVMVNSEIDIVFANMCIRIKIQTTFFFRLI